jgi:hypothetical protein
MILTALMIRMIVFADLLRIFHDSSVGIGWVESLYNLIEV